MQRDWCDVTRACILILMGFRVAMNCTASGSMMVDRLALAVRFRRRAGLGLVGRSRHMQLAAHCRMPLARTIAPHRRRRSRRSCTPSERACSLHRHSAYIEVVARRVGLGRRYKCQNICNRNAFCITRRKQVGRSELVQREVLLNTKWCDLHSTYDRNLKNGNSSSEVLSNI